MVWRLDNYFGGPLVIALVGKPIILLGVIIGAITAIILTGIHSIWQFHCSAFHSRFLWSRPLLCFQALYYEIYLGKDQLSRVMSTHHACLYDRAALLPPVIGGYIVKYSHWHMIFLCDWYDGISCRITRLFHYS